jgi:tetratricopeptide (TPR) repeat protein
MLAAFAVTLILNHSRDVLGLSIFAFRLGSWVCFSFKLLCQRPDHAEALFNRAVTLQKLRRFEEALASYERALVLRPDYVEALNNRGTLFLPAPMTLQICCVDIRSPAIAWTERRSLGVGTNARCPPL